MSRQEPEPKLRRRKWQPGIWEARYRRYTVEGTVERPGEVFHAFPHSFNELIVHVGTDDPDKVREVQIKLLRQGDKLTNDRYGKLAPPLRQRARQALINVSDLAMGETVF